MKNWSIHELRGKRENVINEIQAMQDVPDEWKAALLVTINGFMPEFNGVRVDAHAQEMQSRVPLPLNEFLKMKEQNKDASPERINGGLCNYHISISALKLSGD